MIGAIIGDIVGSRFEWDNHKSKDFDFLTHKCFFTDDSVMSLAVCDALMCAKPDYSDLSEKAVESTSFEDAVRNAISIGGDSDTLAAITGAVAEACYGVPANIRKHALTFLDERLLKILLEFENEYPAKFEKVQENSSIGVQLSTD
jgi:ADP-ribosylglycohydrolase